MKNWDTKANTNALSQRNEIEFCNGIVLGIIIKKRLATTTRHCTDHEYCKSLCNPFFLPLLCHHVYRFTAINGDPKVHNFQRSPSIYHSPGMDFFIYFFIPAFTYIVIFFGGSGSCYVIKFRTLILCVCMNLWSRSLIIVGIVGIWWMERFCLLCQELDFIFFQKKKKRNCFVSLLFLLFHFPFSCLEYWVLIYFGLIWVVYLCPMLLMPLLNFWYVIVIWLWRECSSETYRKFLMFFLIIVL